MVNVFFMLARVWWTDG